MEKEIEEKKFLVRVEIANNIKTKPEILALLARDPDYRVREGVAKNINTRPEILALLARDVNYRVREGVACNTFS